jgi:hypothetical protein
VRRREPLQPRPQARRDQRQQRRDDVHPREVPPAANTAEERRKPGLRRREQRRVREVRPAVVGEERRQQAHARLELPRIGVERQ